MMMAMPEMAVPFFKTLHSAAGVPAAPLNLMPLRADRAAARRNPAPQAMADGGFEGETPMQRAERELCDGVLRVRFCAGPDRRRVHPKDKTGCSD